MSCSLMNLMRIFFDPYATKEVNILGKGYPLPASFSSTYATWLSENNLQRASLLNMIAKKDSATMPKLFMLSPYNLNQKSYHHDS